MWVVTAALDLANVQPGQKLLDIGSGDGRWCREATKRGLYAVGWEVDAGIRKAATEIAALDGSTAVFMDVDCYAGPLTGFDWIVWSLNRDDKAAETLATRLALGQRAILWGAPVDGLKKLVQVELPCEMRRNDSYSVQLQMPFLTHWDEYWSKQPVADLVRLFGSAEPQSKLKGAVKIYVQGL